MDFDDLEIEQLRRRSGVKWQSFADDVLPAWVADMDFTVAEPIQALLWRTADCSEIGYPSPPGPSGLLAVFADRMQERFGWTVDPRLVDVITDVVQGIYVGIEVFSEPGDGVLVQTPIYPPFLSAVAETRRQLVENTLVEGEGGYQIDFAALEGAIDSRTRVLLLCNPHNPTGRVFTRDELVRLAEIAIEHELIVISDEIHADLVYAGHRHIPVATLSPEVEARTLTLTSATKSFNIAGVRCAIAASGSPAIQERFNSIPPHLRGGLGSLGLAATRVAWTECQGWLDEVVAYLQGNRDFLTDFVRIEMPAIRHLPPEASFLAWLDCSELRLKPTPMQHFLNRARVGLSDGSSFGEVGRSFVRMNFATSRRILTAALERMARSLDR